MSLQISQGRFRVCFHFELSTLTRVDLYQTVVGHQRRRRVPRASGRSYVITQRLLRFFPCSERYTVHWAGMGFAAFLLALDGWLAHAALDQRTGAFGGSASLVGPEAGA